ncbi:MAG TPA: TetR/AcrR family transcriptional regulator [Streptosporangiaceae bacterium]|nr:TetR/AcrR family transcriptional regulator [Streptosporangiaceae bacterium]
MRGRPRDPRVEEAILRATLDLLAESGYTRLSIEAVARRAAVSRPTVYLRWRSKAHLVHEAVFPDMTAEELPVPANATFAEDVRHLVDGAVVYLSRPEVLAATPALMAEFADDPQLHRLMAARLDDRIRARLREHVAGAVARGEVRAGLDADVLLDAITGSVLFMLLIRPADAHRFAGALTDLLLHGLLTP